MAFLNEYGRKLLAPLSSADELRTCDCTATPDTTCVTFSGDHCRLADLSHSRIFREACIGIIGVLSRTVQICDPHTFSHQERVSELAGAVGEELGLDTDVIVGLKYGALIHDIGKIGIPTQLLTAARMLNNYETAIMRTHPMVGAEIVRDTWFPWPIREMVLQHHERLDGSGYPEGLKGGEILLEARIIAVVDVVEAMTHHRPYRPALGLHAGLSEVRRYSGTLYDPDAVDACVRVMERSQGQVWAPQLPHSHLTAL
jgi:putative two-component system response regulator